jgi:hypothetical protein
MVVVNVLHHVIGNQVLQAMFHSYEVNKAILKTLMLDRVLVSQTDFL